jgi:hypothetical protein
MPNTVNLQLARDILVAYLQNREGRIPSNDHLADTGKALGEMFKQLLTAVEQAAR